MINTTDKTILGLIMDEIKNSNVGYNLTIPMCEEPSTMLEVEPEAIINDLFLRDWLLIPGERTMVVTHYHHIQLFAKSDKREIHIGAGTGDVRMISVIDFDDEHNPVQVYSDLTMPAPNVPSQLGFKLFDVSVDDNVFEKKVGDNGFVLKSLEDGNVVNCTNE